MAKSPSSPKLRGKTRYDVFKIGDWDWRTIVRFTPESGPFSALAFMSAFDP